MVVKLNSSNCKRHELLMQHRDKETQKGWEKRTEKKRELRERENEEGTAQKASNGDDLGGKKSKG